jgi:hypothetical protein
MEVHMSQTDAQNYRRYVRTKLDDELVTHDAARCEYCRNGAVCLDLTYAHLAEDLVRRRTQRRTVGGPS